MIYLLERFPGGTLNFVYNEIRCLEASGVDVDIFSLLESEYCPTEALVFRERTQVLLPARLTGVLAAWTYFLFRKPIALAKVLLTIPFDNESNRLGKAIKTYGHIAYGVYFSWLIRNRSDHIHAHFAFKAATVALVASALNGNTFSFTAHGSATAHRPSRFSLRSKVRRAKFVVAVSEFNRQAMLDLCPDVAPDRIVVNRTGILLEQFPLRDSAWLERRSGPYRVTCVATLYPIKNHAALVRAVALLVREGLDISVNLVGRDESGVGAEVSALASSLGILERITFHGAVDHSEIVAILGESDVAILTSYSEGVPVSLMEAMAVGVPAIGPRVTGVPELIRDGVTGLLVDPTDPDNIASAIGKMLRHECDVPSLVAAGRAFIEAEYDMAANARRLATMFEQRLVG